MKGEWEASSVHGLCRDAPFQAPRSRLRRRRLRYLFLTRRPSPLNRAIVDWRKDKKARGGYSSEVSFLASSGEAGCRKASMGTHLDF